MALRIALFSCIVVCSTAVFARPPIPVFVKAVTIEPFAETIEALGTLRANEAVTLSASVTETITVVHFDDGQRVKAGDVLAEMTSSEEHALLEDAQLTAAEAQRQYQRVKSLIKSKLSTESELDQKRVAFESARAKFHATQSRLQDRLIIAPFDGVLGLRNVSVGSLVKPGDTITTLDDDSVMKLDITVPAVFIGSLKPGLGVIAHSKELNDGEFVGKIISIDSRVDPITRSIVVRALLPNEQRALKPGMLMTVKLQKPQRQSVMLPEEALVQEGFNQYAYVVNQSQSPTTVEKRQITTGPRRPGAIVVERGLKEGEWVVTHGIMRLKDGAQVNVSAIEQGNESLDRLLKQKQQPITQE